jgi:hypothetical protein
VKWRRIWGPAANVPGMTGEFTSNWLALEHLTGAETALIEAVIARRWWEPQPRAPGRSDDRHPGCASPARRRVHRPGVMTGCPRCASYLCAGHAPPRDCMHEAEASWRHVSDDHRVSGSRGGTFDSGFVWVLGGNYACQQASLFDLLGKLRGCVDPCECVRLLRHDSLVEPVDLLKGAVVQPEEHTSDQLGNRPSDAGR